MNDKIEYGYCHCGCGQKTTVSAYNYAKRGRIKGVPVKYILGHSSKGYVATDELREKRRMAGYKRKQTKLTKEKISKANSGREPIYSPFVPDLLIHFSKKEKRWYCLNPLKHKKHIPHAKAVWEYFNGPVPEGHHVHHKNGKHLLPEDDSLEKIMIIPSEWNFGLLPALSRHFGVEEEVVTNIYISCFDHVCSNKLFREVCKKLIEITE